MPSLNKVMLMGNLTRDPEPKITAGGLSIASFGMAINRKFQTKDGQSKEEVVFVDITAFGKQADTISQYTSKGSLLLIEGRLKLDSWQDQQGNNRTKLTVVLESFQFVGGKSEQQQEPQKPITWPGPNTSSDPKPKPEPKPELEKYMDENEDDLPF